MACMPPSYATGFLQGTLDFVDCQAQTIGQQGYQALAAPGSPAATILTGLLTLFVAVIGFRMLFADTPTPREGVMSFVKLGVVLALATSWPAYRTLVYDVTLRGPADLAATAGGASGLPGSGGGLVSRLQALDRGMIVLSQYGVGIPASRQGMNPGAEGAVVSSLDASRMFDSTALGYARTLFLIGTIAAFASVRLVSGLLLALGPFFIGCLLFEGTRGLFEGWVRALVGAALGGAAVAVLLGVELALLEPWIANLIALRQAKYSITGVPIELFAATASFAIALFVAIAAVAKVAMGFKLPAPLRNLAAQWVPSTFVERASERLRESERSEQRTSQRSRAETIAESVAASQRRDIAVLANAQRRSAGTMTATSESPFVLVTRGNTGSRRALARTSRSASKRDRR